MEAGAGNRDIQRERGLWSRVGGQWENVEASGMEPRTWGPWAGGFRGSGRCCQVASDFFSLALGSQHIQFNTSVAWLGHKEEAVRMARLFVFHASASNRFPAKCPRKLTPFWGGPALVLPLQSAAASVSLGKWLMGWVSLPGMGGGESCSSLTN